MAEPEVGVSSIEPRIDLGRSGIIRTVESLSESEQQNILAAIAKTHEDFAKVHTNYAYKQNLGVIPTHDELSQGHFRDFNKETYPQMVQSHNYAMGGHYSVGGILWRETPVNLLTVPLDFLRAINFEGKKENHEAKIKEWEKDYDAGIDKIHNRANKRHNEHRFAYKSQGSGLDDASLKKYLNDMGKGIKDDILKSLPKQLDVEDLKKYIETINAKTNADFDKKMSGYSQNITAEMDSLKKIIETLQRSPQNISTSVESTLAHAEGRYKKHLPKRDETEYMIKESRVYIDAYEAGVKFTKELYDGYIPKEVFIKENNMILGTLDIFTNILEVATAEGRLEKDSERYKEMTNYIDILRKAAEKEKDMDFKEKKPRIKEHEYGWTAYI